MTVAVVLLAVAIAVVTAICGTVLVRYRRAQRSARRFPAAARASQAPGQRESGVADLVRATEAAPLRAASTGDLGDAIDALTDRLRDLERSGELRAAWMRRLGEVIARMTEGVVISDADGRVLFRDDTELSAISARHGHALMDAALSRVLNRACEGMTVREEVRLYGPPQRVFMLSASPMAGGGVALIEDITERERVETMRRDFVSNISHELRTPVGAISLLAETIVDLLSDSVDVAGEVAISAEDHATVVGLADRMVAEAERMTRAIDDLAELSRVERDVDGDRSVLAFGDVVNAVVERLTNAAEQRGIAVTVAAPSEPVLIRADRRQVASAVHNLLDNALKYSPAGTSVNMRVRRRETSAELSVQDRGIGIPQGDLPRIFERFYRVDRSRTSSSGGIGLGLAIVRHVAINHHGDVEVQSMEGEGSTFTLRLPLVAESGASEPPDPLGTGATGSPLGELPRTPAAMRSQGRRRST